MSYDVSAFRQSQPNQLATQVLADDLDSGRIVSGTPKLVQRIVLQFMTRQGSIPQSQDGCEFVDRLVNGKVATEADVFMAAVSSLGTVKKAIAAEQISSDLPEEQLVSLRVGGLTLAPGQVNLSLVLTTADGGSLVILLPLDFILQ